MKKTYSIEVDCANCANLMEEATQKTAGVANATVNFMTQKMIVEFEDGQDAKAVMKNVLKACKKVEPELRNRALIYFGSTRIVQKNDRLRFLGTVGLFHTVMCHLTAI